MNTIWSHKRTDRKRARSGVLSENLTAIMSEYMGDRAPHDIVQHERDSPKLDICCAISQKKVYGPYFAANIVTWIAYLDYVRKITLPSVGNRFR